MLDIGGAGGKASASLDINIWLEPIVKDYPEYGSGGAKRCIKIVEEEFSKKVEVEENIIARKPYTLML